MQVEMATNDMKGSKPSSYIDSSRSRGSATRYNSTLTNIAFAPETHKYSFWIFNDVGDVWRRYRSRSRGGRRSRSRDREPRLPLALFLSCQLLKDPL